jgi:hypothetical protein
MPTDPTRPIGAPKIVRFEPLQPEGKSLTGLVSNIGSSAKNLLENTLAAVMHPIQTGTTMLDIALGITQKMLPASSRSEAALLQQQVADAMGQYFAQRYGSVQGVQEAAYNDPVGVLADVSSVLTLAGGTAMRVGSLSKLGRRVVQIGEVVRGAGDAVNPLRPITAAAKPAMEALGTGVIEATVRPPAAVKKQQNARFETSRTIREQRLLSEQAAANRGREVSAATAAAARNLGPIPMQRQPMMDAVLNKAAMEAAKRTGFVKESEDAALNAIQRIERDTKPVFVPEESLQYRQNADRLSTDFYKHQDALLPTSPIGMEGFVQAQWGNQNRNALRQLSPEIASGSDLRRRLMLAEAALETAGDRPHALTRMLGAGTAGLGNPAVGGAMLAMDSPLAGTSLGALLDVLAKILGHPETRTHAGFGRLVQAGTSGNPRPIPQ